jgi:hypothetical protein
VGGGIVVSILYIALIAGGYLGLLFQSLPFSLLAFMLAFVSWIFAIYHAYSYAKDGPTEYNSIYLKSLVQASVFLTFLLSFFIFMFTFNALH